LAMWGVEDKAAAAAAVVCRKRRRFNNDMEYSFGGKRDDQASFEE